MSWNCGHQTGDGKTLPGGVDLGLGWCQVYQLWVDFPDFINLLEDLVFVLPQKYCVLRPKSSISHGVGILRPGFRFCRTRVYLCSMMSFTQLMSSLCVVSLSLGVSITALPIYMLVLCLGILHRSLALCPVNLPHNHQAIWTATHGCNLPRASVFVYVSLNPGLGTLA